MLLSYLINSTELNSSKILCSGIRSLKLWLRLLCSASVVDKAISDCSLEDQAIGQLAYFMMKPDRLKTERKEPESFKFHPPTKSASAQSSNPMLRFGQKIKPLSLVLVKCLRLLQKGQLGNKREHRQCHVIFFLFRLIN